MHNEFGDTSQPASKHIHFKIFFMRTEYLFIYIHLCFLKQLILWEKEILNMND